MSPKKITNIIPNFKKTYICRLGSELNQLNRSGVPDRASRRLFTGAILKPGGNKFTGDVSQKILSATACRYFTFWLCNFLNSFAENDDPSLYLGKLPILAVYFWKP